MTKMIDEVPHEQVTVMSGKKALTLWVSPDGSVTTYNQSTKGYDDIDPQYHTSPRDDLESRINFMNDYMFFEFFGHKRFLLCDIVARAYHPDYEPHGQHDRYQYFFRDNNPKNCSVGNIILKVPVVYGRVKGIF